METIFIYNLSNLDTTTNKNKTINLNKDQKNIKKINKNYILKKHLGTSYGGDIFQIKHEKPSIEKNYKKITKIICKKVDLGLFYKKPKSRTKNQQEVKTYIKEYVKNIQSIKRHPVGRQYVNGIITYKIINNYLYVFYPYYKGNNINNLKTHLMKMENENFKTLIKYLIKKMLAGLNILSNLNLNLDTSRIDINESIIINTSKLNSEKRPDIKIKFYNIIPNVLKTDISNNHILYSNCMNDILSYRYKLEYKTSLKHKLHSLKKMFVNKATKKSLKNKLPPIKEILPSDIYEYYKIINDIVINPKTFKTYDIIVKDILLNEKYGDYN